MGTALVVGLAAGFLAAVVHATYVSRTAPDVPVLEVDPRRRVTWPRREVSGGC